MPRHANQIEVFLQPGDFYFGDKDTRIRTLLGSCVSITLWHPTQHIGGMCHYLMPTRQPHDPADPLDPRYADEAMLMFMRELWTTRTVAKDYEVKMFGGGRQFSHGHGHHAKSIDVSDRNIQTGLGLLDVYNLKLSAKHLGGHGPRQVIFDLSSGHVWMRHTDIHPKAADHDSG